MLTRYRPRPQPFPQPLKDVPLLLVHGYTQNRRAWSTGEFVKNMLFFGADLFLLELRGHGKSSPELQRRRARAAGVEPPADIDFGWDLDSHLLFDLPAAIAAVKRASGRDKIFYCGHSLGGILGYAYATLFDDLLGLITIGAPSDFSRLPLWLRAVSFGPLRRVSRRRRVARGREHRARSRRARCAGCRACGRRRARSRRGASSGCRSAPRSAGSSRTCAARCTRRSPARMPFSRPLLYQPRNVALGALRPLLREGANDEPRATLEQLARWARRGELTSPALRHDIAAAFPRIRIPLAIFFGDEDPLASVQTTRSVYRAASSEYLLWRPVRGNSHLELTMGYDIRQICYDVKNLMTYALDHEGAPRPRCRAAAARADTDRWSSTWFATRAFERGPGTWRRDPPLSELGRAQAAALAARLAPIRFDRCLVSPLARAQETARALVDRSRTRARDARLSRRGRARRARRPGRATRRAAGTPSTSGSGTRCCRGSPRPAAPRPDGETSAEFVARARVAHALVREPLFDPQARALVVVARRTARVPDRAAAGARTPRRGDVRLRHTARSRASRRTARSPTTVRSRCCAS